MKSFIKKAWYFIWEDNSLLSWVVNVILAFILVKFVVYPVLGLLFGTNYPIVAVISGSMEHNGLNFDSWWDQNKDWYLKNDISKEDLSNSIFKNGFNKGDIIILRGEKPTDIKKYQVIVYSSDRYKYPIIHRVVHIDNTVEDYRFKTKGDNNPVEDPADITSKNILGTAMLKIPWLGWIKIIFTSIIGGV